MTCAPPGRIRQVSFATRVGPRLRATPRPGALLANHELETDAAQILVKDVDVAFVLVARHFHPMPRATEHSIHPTAVVHPEAELEEPVSIGPQTVLGRCSCRRGARSSRPTSRSVTVSRSVGDCVLYPNVTIYDHATIGDRFCAHGACVIGSDGFGFAPEGGTWHKVPQFGGVEIGNDVELGAGTVIDRGAVNNTVIGDGCKFDNLCHIAHNAVIGKNCVMAAGCMVAGSSTVGDNNVWGGKCACGGHLTIAANVRMGGGTQALKSIREPGEYMGYPHTTKKNWVRINKALGDLPDIRAEWQDRNESDD